MKRLEASPILALLETQSRFGDKLLGIRVKLSAQKDCSAVFKGLHDL